jgi:hypothetical protein
VFGRSIVLVAVISLFGKVAWAQDPPGLQIPPAAQEATTSTSSKTVKKPSDKEGAKVKKRRPKAKAPAEEKLADEAPAAEAQADPNAPTPCQAERLKQLGRLVRALEAEQDYIDRDIAKLGKRVYGANPFPDGPEQPRVANVTIDGMTTPERQKLAADSEPLADKLARLEREAEGLQTSQDEATTKIVHLEVAQGMLEERRKPKTALTSRFPIDRKKQLGDPRMELYP